MALHQMERIEVAFLVIPPWSGGFIPFARVAHARYLVVDGERLWLGTSNWLRDYFHQNRNVGVVIDDAAPAARLDAFFTDSWRSRYTSWSIRRPPRAAARERVAGERRHG